MRWFADGFWITGILAAVLLAGCATTGSVPSDSGEMVTEPCPQALDSDGELQMEMVQHSIQAGRPHAALAQLEILPAGEPQVAYMRAEILRQLDRPGAKDIYEALVDSCMAAEAMHGLGLLAAADGDFETAEAYMREARERLPLNARVRNDFGFVQLLRDAEVEAAFEFRTALELDQGHGSAAANLALLYMSRDEMEQAAEVINQYELTADDVADIERRLDHLDAFREQRRLEELPIGETPVAELGETGES